MVYQIVIAAGLALFVVNLFLNLRSLRVPRRDSKIPGKPPLVSVLVPARDEEANIGACLDSLQVQDYPNYEILVLDDNSTDGTAAIVRRAAARDDRVRLIEGGVLPSGWAGKPNACYQLGKEAKGDWLLFVDADTTHAPHMLRSVLAEAIRLNTSLLSGFPRQTSDSLPQKVAIPIIYFIIMSWLPMWCIHCLRKSIPSLAIGQFLLFSREAYWRIGGHKAVKSRILEDVWLGIETARHGGRHVAIDLSSVVSCNMYRDFPSMWEGFIKWGYSLSALIPGILFVLVIIGTVFFLAPFYWLWNGFFMVEAPTVWRLVVMAQIAIILLMRGFVDNRFKESGVSALLHPFGMSYLIVAFSIAGMRRTLGIGVNWKKRLYRRESTIE